MRGGGCRGWDRDLPTPGKRDSVICQVGGGCGGGGGGRSRGNVAMWHRGNVAGWHGGGCGGGGGGSRREVVEGWGRPHRLVAEHGRGGGGGSVCCFRLPWQAARGSSRTHAKCMLQGMAELHIGHRKGRQCGARGHCETREQCRRGCSRLFGDASGGLSRGTWRRCRLLLHLSSSSSKRLGISSSAISNPGFLLQQVSKGWGGRRCSCSGRRWLDWAGAARDRLGGALLVGTVQHLDGLSWPASSMWTGKHQLYSQ